MERIIGTAAMGLRAPIIKEGDDLVSTVFDVVKKASDQGDINLRDKDVVCVTESLVARAQGNYVTIEDIAKDVNAKFEGDELAILFPILSRNRFSILLKAFALTGKKLHICLSYPQDEVGNWLMDEMDLFNSDINPYQDVLDINQYKELAGDYKHEFTGISYPDLYKEIAPNSEIHFLNNPVDALQFTDQILVSSIHTRNLVKRKLEENGAGKVLKLDEIMTAPIDGSGFNENYGLLGSNLSTGNMVKLFPRDGQVFVDSLQKRLIDEFDKKIEVMIYGDGAFKDPVGKIWELADPVVSPAYTSGLEGTPSELKIKYIADNELTDLEGEDRDEAMRDRISHKAKELVGKNETLGTTPRQITDLLGSLCDLTSGSGDKGTPIVLIQGYFDNYSDK
ncbi:coenzyme F420-0:L-glutamate ligase [uncultured Anaerococcus sp.]|uniref:coenzyme F420-0:L-glutamate ligase n=1 Tax=uncultured Anaerococcus sp. TaxID=293428 RepID=UPI002609A09F|nr:coenzyme F420-0:L-glutamate ligase [uncultured Anaerococcus sp.]